jgi:hypothetical protein
LDKRLRFGELKLFSITSYWLAFISIKHIIAIPVNITLKKVEIKTAADPNEISNSQFE